jgi:hypothetical protein
MKRRLKKVGIALFFGIDIDTILSACPKSKFRAGLYK